MKSAWGWIVFTVCVAVWAVWVPQLSAAQLPGSIELTEANALLRAYAVHMVEQQPPELRRAWRSQVHQVKLSKKGLYALTGVHGRIVFEYLPESKTLDCLSPVFSSRRRPVRPWVMRALKEAAARGVSTGGAELIYDQVSKFIFLRETFVKSPANRTDFIETCDLVKKTGQLWRRKHFLPALKSFYARHAPPASAAARAGDFWAVLVVSEDQAAFQSVWDRPAKARQPTVWTLDKAAASEPVYAFVLFSGCTPNPAGRCQLTGSLGIQRPDGSLSASVPSIPLWNGPAPPAGHLQMAQQSLKIAIDEKDPLGTYGIGSQVCDGSAHRCVKLSLPFEFAAKVH